MLRRSATILGAVGVVTAAVVLAACSVFGGENDVPKAPDGPADATTNADGSSAADAAAGDASSVETGPVDPIPPDGRLVFVSKALPKGDFTVAGADALCESEAESAGRKGAYVAFIATKSTTSGHGSAIGRLAAAPVWYLRSGIPIGPRIPDLNGTGPQHAIDQHADGTAATIAPFAVWTGALVGGASSLETCDDWTGAGVLAMGRVGDLRAVTARWVDDTTQSCAQQARFYCFEK